MKVLMRLTTLPVQFRLIAKNITPPAKTSPESAGNDSHDQKTTHTNKTRTSQTNRFDLQNKVGPIEAHLSHAARRACKIDYTEVQRLTMCEAASTSGVRCQTVTPPDCPERGSDTERLLNSRSLVLFWMLWDITCLSEWNIAERTESVWRCER